MTIREQSIRRLNDAWATYCVAIRPEADRSEEDMRSAVLALRDVLESELAGWTPEISESAVRGRARALGYSMSKSRDKSLHTNNCGEFRLCDDRNTVILGDRFDASLQQIADYLAELA
jgi:hypothetical protein